MDLDFNVHEFYEQMRRETVILSFKGVVSQDLLSRLAANLKNRSSGDSTMIGKRVFAIFIELSQNVNLHSAEKSYSIKEDKPIGIGFLLVSEAEDHYMVSSSNLADKKRAEATIERCKYINSLDKEGLKDFYKDQRRQPQRTESPGANVGLIDMVRKSNNPIQAEIYPYSEEQSFLTISVKLDK
ncbi:MAG: SiaB family protein kinase [Bernardetiaceae bacterium]|nr:SiaB family protein kinase [Bernardetiaceae bacterium]